MTQPHPQPNPNELLSITREELERCCSQMSAAGYKVSANYVEAMVLSRSSPHTPAAPATFPNSTELIQMAETEWHNREERFGLHDKIPWTTGWMSGFLTPNKPGLCDKCNILEVEDRLMELEQELKDARKDVQPFIDLVILMETKQKEMNEIMRKHNLKIDNLDDPMQKLAFTFYAEIAEIAHKAEVVIKEYEESTQQQAGDQHE